MAAGGGSWVVGATLESPWAFKTFTLTVHATRLDCWQTIKGRGSALRPLSNYRPNPASSHRYIHPAGRPGGPAGNSSGAKRG